MRAVSVRKLVLLGTAFVVVVWASAAFAAAGGLDTTFSGDGKQATDITTGFDGAASVAVQPDGKVVAAGWTSGNGGQFALTRYNTNGSLDSTFSGDGKLATNFTSGDDYALDVIIQADGKILAVGVAAGSGGHFALARYKTNGGLDTTFSGDGKVLTNFSSGFDGATGVALQPNGKIVVVGVAENAGGDTAFAFAKYNPDGSRDSLFGVAGKTKIDLTGGFDEAWDVALQPDNFIVVAGIADGAGGQFGLVRLTPFGDLDSQFNGSGKVFTNLTTGFDGASGVAIQGDGNIVVAGWAAGGGGQFALARYETNGHLDSTFSGDGKVATNLTTGDDYAMHLALQDDGKIVAVGHAAGSGGQFALTRYKTNGSLDTTFSGDGKLATNFTTGFDRANRVAIDPAGRIVVAGMVGGGGGRFGIARYLAQ